MYCEENCRSTKGIRGVYEDYNVLYSNFNRHFLFADNVTRKND